MKKREKVVRLGIQAGWGPWVIFWGHSMHPEAKQRR